MTLDVGAGGFVCHAAEDGIRAAGNSAVHVVVGAGGDVDIAAGAVGIRSEGTALVDENALRTDGNADRRLRGRRPATGRTRARATGATASARVATARARCQ